MSAPLTSVGSGAGRHRVPQSGQIPRLPARTVALVVLIGVLQALVLGAFILTISAVVTALLPTTVGAAATGELLHVLRLTGVLALIGILTSVLRWLEFSIAESAGYEMVRVLRMRMYAHLQRMLPEHLNHRARGGLLLRLTGDLSTLRLWTSRGQLLGTSSAIVLALGLVSIVTIDVALAGALVLVVALGAILSILNGRPMRRATRQMRRRRSLVIGNISEQLNALPTIQVAGRRGGEYSRLSRQNDSLNDALVRQAWLRGRLRGLAVASSMLTSATVLAVGAVQIHRGMLTLVEVVTVLMVTRFLTRHIKTLGLAHDYWQRGQVSRAKIEDYFASSSRDADEDHYPRLRVPRGEVRFTQVDTAGGLRGLTAVAPARHHIALVGGPRSGAVEVLRLVARLTDPVRGTLEVDDQDVTAHRPWSDHGQIAMYSHDLPLLRGTIRRNLGYNAPEAEAVELQRVALASGLDQVLDRFEDEGAAGWLVDAGRNLEPSERALLAFARTFVGNPRIVLLHDPIPDLPAAQREAARRMIARHRGLVLWHTTDPEDISTADEVWYFERGRLVRTAAGADVALEQWRNRQEAVLV